MALGIAFDIGAYSCKAAKLRTEDGDVTNLLNNDPLRSVVYVDVEQDNKIIFGEQAMRRYARDSQHGFDNIKRHILKGDYELPGVPGMSYIDLYAALIEEVYDRCYREVTQSGDTIERVVLTVPSFLEIRDVISEMRRTAETTLKKKDPNLEVELLVEPAGVAIHNLDMHKRKSDEERTVIVYDLGHSTLDVALVTYQNRDGYSYVLHYDYADDDTFGAFFDKKIAEAIENYIFGKYTDINERDAARVKNRAKEIASEIKHTLSTTDFCTMDIGWGDVYEEYTMTRTQFEDLIRENLMNSVPLVSEAISIAAEKGLHVDEIILAGGGASIPLVEQCVKTVAGNIPVTSSRHPLYAVAYGAARYGLVGRLLQKSKLAYGIQLPVEEGSLERKVYFIAPSNSDLPYKSEESNGLKFECDDDGVFYTILYSAQDGEPGKEKRAEDCNQIRHMKFCIGVNEPVSVLMEIDEEHCVKVVCKTGADERYVMTSFDPANAVSRKE